MYHVSSADAENRTQKLIIIEARNMVADGLLVNHTNSIDGYRSDSYPLLRTTPLLLQTT